RRDVLHMRLLEESQPARDGEGNTAPREFELHLERVKVRAVENGDLAKIHALLVEFEDALSDECGLRVVRRERNERGTHAHGGTHGAEILPKLAFVAEDGSVRKFEDLGHAAIVRLDLVNDGVGVLLGKTEDVLEIRAAPRIDRLRVV